MIRALKRDEDDVKFVKYVSVLEARKEHHQLQNLHQQSIVEHMSDDDEGEDDERRRFETDCTTDSESATIDVDTVDDDPVIERYQEVGHHLVVEHDQEVNRRQVVEPDQTVNNHQVVETDRTVNRHPVVEYELVDDALTIPDHRPSEPLSNSDDVNEEGRPTLMLRRYEESHREESTTSTTNVIADSQRRDKMTIDLRDNIRSDGGNKKDDLMKQDAVEFVDRDTRLIYRDVVDYIDRDSRSRQRQHNSDYEGVLDEPSNKNKEQFATSVSETVS